MLCNSSFIMRLRLVSAPCCSSQLSRRLLNSGSRKLETRKWPKRSLWRRSLLTSSSATRVRCLRLRCFHTLSRQRLPFLEQATSTSKPCEEETYSSSYWYSVDHTPSIAFWHLPPNSVRIGYTTEGALFISVQLSSDAVGGLWKVWVLIRLWKQQSFQVCT